MKGMETRHRDLEWTQREGLETVSHKDSVESEEFHQGSGECRGK